MKKEPQPQTPRSVWERIWTADEFKSHEMDFQEIRSEIMHLPISKINPRLLWLEQKGAIKFLETKDYVDYIVRPSCFSEYDAKYSKYTEWLSFRDKNKPIPSLKEITGIDFSVDRKSPDMVDVEAANQDLALAGEEQKI